MIADSTVSRFAAVLAGGLLLSACSSGSSWMPSFDLSALKPAPPTDQVRIESEPAGADARTASGVACRTPCTLNLPVNDGAITVALNGYVPQTIPVQVEKPPEGRTDEFNSPTAHLAPNPLFVELQPNPPPPPVAQKKPAQKKPRVATARPKPAPEQQPAPATTASTTAAAPQQSTYPAWPTPR
jgi:PEGA domain